MEVGGLQQWEEIPHVGLLPGHGSAGGGGGGGGHNWSQCPSPSAWRTPGARPPIPSPGHSVPQTTRLWVILASDLGSVLCWLSNEEDSHTERGRLFYPSERRWRWSGSMLGFACVQNAPQLDWSQHTALNDERRDSSCGSSPTGFKTSLQFIEILILVQMFIPSWVLFSCEDFNWTRVEDATAKRKILLVKTTEGFSVYKIKNRSFD